MFSSIITKLFLGCLLTPVPTELQQPWMQACESWWPYHAQVSIRYCVGYDECEKVIAFSGGLYDFQKHTITVTRERVRPELMDPALYNMGEVTERYLLLLHEYGHALGLPHSSRDDSVMHPGWTWPLALEPSKEDFETLRER